MLPFDSQEKQLQPGQLAYQ